MHYSLKKGIFFVLGFLRFTVSHNFEYNEKLLGQFYEITAL